MRDRHDVGRQTEQRRLGLEAFDELEQGLPRLGVGRERLVVGEHGAGPLDGEQAPQDESGIGDLRGQLLTGEESLHLQQDVAGGAGEGTASADYLWWPPHKVSGRYLAPWLEGDAPHFDPTPPRHPIDVEIALPKEWHTEPMAFDPFGPTDVK